MKAILFTLLLAFIFAVISAEAAATPVTQDVASQNGSNAAANQAADKNAKAAAAKAAADKAKADKAKNKSAKAKNANNKNAKAKDNNAAANANANANANAAANVNANANNNAASAASAAAVASAAKSAASSDNNADNSSSNVDNSNVDNSNVDNSNVDNNDNNNSLQDLLDQLLGGNNNNNDILGNLDNLDNNSNDNLVASATSTAASATRTRPCDQGDISLAAGLTANIQVGLGAQASVVTLQGLLANGSNSDIAAAIARLQQFVSTANLQLQMCLGIADDNSFAQPQLALLGQEIAVQERLAGSLGGADDDQVLAQLLTSFQELTDNSQDGANNAIIDCFLPLTLVSG